MIVAADSANKCLADISVLAEPAITLSTYLKRWLVADNFTNLDLFGDDYSIFLQMVILLLDNPKIQEMREREDRQLWIQAIGPDVFHQMIWQSVRNDVRRR